MRRTDGSVVALQANPGAPGRGIIAVCYFGGSGTTFTLADAANGYQAIAPAARHAEFSGDRIDQALLTDVIPIRRRGVRRDGGNVGVRLLDSAAQLVPVSRRTALVADHRDRRPSMRPATVVSIRLTGGDLDEAIRQPLDGFVGFFHNVLQRNGIGLEDLAAVVSVGGGASIPLVTRTLSEQSGALVITAPRPHLTAAVGAALRAARGPGDSETALAPTAAGSIADATTRSGVAADVGSPPALAWSEADDDSGIMPLRAGEYSDEAVPVRAPAGQCGPRLPVARGRRRRLVSPPRSGSSWHGAGGAGGRCRNHDHVAAHVWQHADTQRRHHSRAHEPESRFIRHRYADQQPTVIDRIGYRNALVDYERNADDHHERSPHHDHIQPSDHHHAGATRPKPISAGAGRAAVLPAAATRLPLVGVFLLLFLVFLLLVLTELRVAVVV